MKISAIVLFWLLAMSAAGWAETPKNSATPSSDQKATAAVLKVDDEFNKACIAKDRGALERVLADDLSWVARGDRLDKKQVIADILDENLHFRKLEHDSLQIKLFGNTAVVTGHSTSVLDYKGKLFTTPRLFTTVYMNLNGKWQMVAHQVSNTDELQRAASESK